MSATLKRRFRGDDDSMVGGSAKRYKCPTSPSPLVVSGMNKNELVARLQKMYPRLSSAVIAQTLRSVNYSAELAAEQLQRISSQQADQENYTETELSSAPSSLPQANLKRRFDEIETEQQPSASSSDPIPTYAKNLVRNLQGVPSFDEAERRVGDVLRDFQTNHLNRRDAAAAAAHSSSSGASVDQLKAANAVLARGCNEAYAKLKEMKPKVDDYDRIAQELAAKEAQLAEAAQQNDLLKQQNQHLQWAVQHATGGHQPLNPFNGQGPPSLF